MNSTIKVILAILVIGIFLYLFFSIVDKETFKNTREDYSSQGGALVQLMAKDPQDSYLITGARPYYPYYPYYPFFSYYYPYHSYPYPYLYY